LQAQFKARTVQKIYTTLVEGIVDAKEGRIEASIGRDPKHRKRMAVLAKRRGGRQANTLFRLLEHLQPAVNPQRLAFSLLEVELLTGRTHQIRVHMAHIRHPVVGDRIYGRRHQPIGCPRQFLHAARLAFAHPVTGAPIDVMAVLPADLRAVLEGLVKVQ
jgi:23S rRNA pseudouridine1911/1915/1917 synthase